jgi:hypothetical protein
MGRQTHVHWEMRLKVRPILMCWLVSLPVDTTAEAGSSPHQQHGGMQRPRRGMSFDKSGQSGSGKDEDPSTMLHRWCFPLAPPTSTMPFGSVRCLGGPTLSNSAETGGRRWQTGITEPELLRLARGPEEVIGRERLRRASENLLGVLPDLQS